MKKNLIYISIILGLLLILGLIISVGVYNYNLSPMSKKDEEIVFTVNKGETLTSIINGLVSESIIRSKLATTIHIKLNDEYIVQAGDYTLNKNMSTTEILTFLTYGSSSGEQVSITFLEGVRFVDYIKKASDILGLDYVDSLDKVTDTTYIENLIDSNKYWFLTDIILDEDIYYPLEGYLFPDTYNFSVNASIYDVVTTMLDTFKLKLEPYIDDIQNSNLTIHEMITLASIVENEASTAASRKDVAGVFINRINKGWSLGSDVTTYYSVGKYMGVGDWVTYDEFRDCSTKYNTRCTSYIGLPIGPINSPSLTSLVASINPTEHSYMYFVADCSQATYLTYNETEHLNIIQKLKNEGKWCDV